jgi:hypothetical protein
MYRSDELEKACQEYVLIPDVPGQIAKGREIVKIIYDNVIAIPLWDSKGINIIQPWVRDLQKGVEELGSFTFSFTGAWLSNL